MKAFKKIAVLIFSLVAAVCAAAGLSACSKTDSGNQNGGEEGEGSGGNVTDASKWNVYDGLAIGFVSDEDCPHGDIDESKSLSELSSKLGERHYMVADFVIQAPSDNDGSGSVTAEVEISPASAVSATVQETNSGDVNEETADGVTTIKATYKIPDKSAVIRKRRLIIRLDATASSLANISLNFDCPSDMPAVKTLQAEKQVVMGYTEGLEFDGAFVSGATDKEIETALIPTVYDGVKITGIGETAFQNCEKLQTVIMPDSVTNIVNQAFYGCTSLKSFTIGGGITDLGTALFRGCDGLEELKVSESNPKFKSAQNCVLTKDGKTVVLACKASVIPDGTETIGAYAFAGCTAAEQINIPESVTEIEEYAFSSCTSLSGVELPKNIKTIGAGAFYGCIGIKEIVIPDGVETCSGSAFSECRIEKATVPYHAYSVLDRQYVKTLIISSGKGIGDSAFGGYGKNVWRALESVTLPDSMTYIDTYAFMFCSKLQEINFGKGLKSIGEYAFDGCKALTKLEFPDSLEGVGRYAFSGCDRLAEVHFGSSFVSLGNWSFYSCDRLSKYYYNGTKEQWGAVTKAAHWRTAAGGKSYTVHCTDGDYVGRC